MSARGVPARDFLISGAAWRRRLRFRSSSSTQRQITSSNRVKTSGERARGRLLAGRRPTSSKPFEGPILPFPVLFQTSPYRHGFDATFSLVVFFRRCLDLLVLGSFVTTGWAPKKAQYHPDADDMGWGDLAYNGNKRVKTPVLDRLSKEGIRLDRFYTMPVCTPAVIMKSRPFHLFVGGLKRDAA